MTHDVKRFTFLIKQKPICTQSPIKTFLGDEKHRELRAKYKLELGLDLLDDRCPNAFNCKTVNSGCIGRPFPIDSEIKEALESINVSITTGNYKGKKVYLAEAIVDCTTCPFRVGCEASCPTQDSFLRRNTKPESNPPESSLVPYDDFEKGIYKALDANAMQHCAYGDWIEESLPLDCLTERQREVMDMYLKDIEQPIIAARLGISQPVVSKHISASKSKLEEFGKARKAIKESISVPKIVVDYYVNNMNHQDISDKEGVSRSLITKSINNWYNSNISK
tara:strand:+ start:2383 stop:3219 length:837 start_codon:yes stop_codon:yes gene_type:complete